MNWTDIQENSIFDYIEDARFDVFDKYDTNYLEVSETISELSYLTHNYFRYYGKFPSKIAKYIIDSLVASGRLDSSFDFIFDNYNGSGTSMVEAKIAGFQSGGIDINPFGVLASNVKTYNYDVSKLNDMCYKLLSSIKSASSSEIQLSMFDVSDTDDAAIEEMNRRIYVEFPDIEKWFDTSVIKDLSIIKFFLLSMPHDRYREFFDLAFFAIIRRVSRAHDAEVRPHVNPKKKQRNAIEAFEKKVIEMITTMDAWNQATSESVVSKTVVCDNANEEQVVRTIEQLKNLFDRQLGLVISHPPYLNCFDYIPVYKLKFLWAFGFDEIYGEYSYKDIKAEEIKSYPAKRDAFINNYFEHNLKAYRAIYESLKPGGYCCIVIGDCTINKELFSVHKMFIHGMESLGYEVKKVTYRSTAYGMGRYAYNHRADYTDKKDGKQDAIIFCQKPIS